MIRQLFFVVVMCSVPGLARSEIADEVQPSAILDASIDLPDCPQPLFDEESLISQLRVELLDARVELGQNESAPLRIVVEAPECGQDEVVLRVSHLSAGYSLESFARIADRPFEERGRVLALLIAEQVRTILADVTMIDGHGTEGGSNEAEEQEASVQEEEPCMDEDAVRQVVSTEVSRALAAQQRPEPLPRRVTLGAAFALRGYPVYDGSVFGGGLHLSIRPVRRVPFALNLDGGFFQGAAQMPRGDVRTRVAGGGLGVAYSDRAARVGGEIGARLWIGWGWFEGLAALEDVGEEGDGGLVIEAMASSVFRYRLVSESRVWLRVGATVGYVIQGLAPTSGGIVVGGIAGPCFSVDIGVEVTFGAE